MSDSLQSLFTWRSLIASEHGPENPTTRLVLLTLSLHMSERGDSCFPSIDLLATETGLSKRAVINNLKLAEATGWIEKRQLKRAGKDWKRNEYRARFGPKDLIERIVASAPDAPANGEFGGALDAPATQNGPDGGARGAPANGEDGGARGAPACGKAGDNSDFGGAPDDTLVVHQVHLSSSVNSTTKNNYGVKSIYYARQLVDIWQKAMPSSRGTIQTLSTCYADDAPRQNRKTKNRFAGLRMLLTGRAEA